MTKNALCNMMNTKNSQIYFPVFRMNLKRIKKQKKLKDLINFSF